MLSGWRHLPSRLEKKEQIQGGQKAVWRNFY
jgi:hypothetical protein